MLSDNFKLRIRSGESFLYRKEGTESQVFELRMRDKVSHFSLQRAYRKALKRYPYFNSSFKIKGESIYLVRNKVKPAVEKRRNLRSLGGVASMRNLLDVTFYERSIFVAFHHGMCDGRGIMPFIKTLMYYYLSSVYNHRDLHIPDVRLVGEEMLHGETSDPVRDGNFAFDPKKVFRVDRTGFELPGVDQEGPSPTLNYRYEYTFELEPFMQVCKQCNCTPPILVALLMQRAVLDVCPLADKPITCYRMKGDGIADLAVGNIITVTGIMKNFSGTIEFDSGCQMVDKQQGDAVKALTDTTEILQAAYALETGNSLPYQVTLTGTVTKIRDAYNPDYSNVSVVIVMDGHDNWPILCYRMKGNDAQWVEVGDKITVTGMITNFRGTIEFDAGCMMTEYLPGGQEIAPSTDEAQILSDLKNLSQGQKLRYVATLTGKVISIDYEYNASYNNITVTMEVNGTQIQCFRLTGDGLADIAVGDTITVTGNMENYGGKLEFSAASNLDSRIAG